MNKKMNKLALAFLATNIIASTVINEIPLGTQAAQLIAATNTADKVAEAKANFHGFSLSADATSWFAKIDEKKKSDYQYDFYINGSFAASWYVNGVSPYANNSTDGIDRIVSQGHTFKEGDVLTATVTIDGTAYEVGKLSLSSYNDAKTAADALFINNDTTKGIKDSTTQAAIDAAKVLANKVTDTTKKAELTKELTLAQNILNAKANFHGLSVNTNATSWSAKIDEKKKSDYGYTFSINGSYAASWYTDGTSPYSNNSTDGIDRIVSQGYTFKEGDVLTATVTFDDTVYEVGKLTISFYNDTKTAVDALFINNDSTKGIKDSTTQAAIDAAQALIGRVTDTTKKAELTKELTLAQNILNAKTNFHGLSVNTNATSWSAKIDEKKKSDYAYTFSINGSYAAEWYTVGTSPYAINSTDGIDRIISQGYAFKEGDVLTATVTFDGTVYEIGKLTVSFYNNAKAATDALFINNDSTKGIKDSTTQATIDAAQVLVNKVTDATKKAALQADIAKAQNELNTRNAEATKQAAATTSVNELFINNNSANHIKDSTNQAAIDAAQAKVNLVTDVSKKSGITSPN
ncbi:toxin Cry1Ac domain D-VI-related protein [Listeria cornellensis]|uniref:Pesticidal crystal protein Cry1Aa domain-containing protein n=1 Tax=Listeria cornellensis FSL F6-0969 TaxID=1265820 RepID=W7CAC7_9LIST|nr:toxin Cry1Ac domain D-VI-related protein [Listeria cornellensis]EUJ29683.1 hypothetical protein PCORN_11137 [Listeria cornellensis FSL F6-0969]